MLVFMPLNSPGLSRENPFLQNAEKSLALASALFPGEEWVAHGENIFIAKSRLSGGHKEQAKLYREIADVRILTDRGSVAYFLPEQSDGAEIGKKYADTVIDGAIVELKTVSGNRTTLGKSFKFFCFSPYPLLKVANENMIVSRSGEIVV